VVGVFVGDQDAIEAVEVFFDGGKARQSFALAQAGVHKEAGAFGFEQRDVARTSGRENGNAQADGDSPRGRKPKSDTRKTKRETCKMMAERGNRVNAQREKSLTKAAAQGDRIGGYG
jgi:hypothetical protein